MATYIPNATQTTEPVESRTVESAALEFRTLKTSINARIEDVQDGLDTEIVNRVAGDANLQTQNNAQDVRLTAIENALLSIGEGGLPGTVYVQRFSGTGVQTAFTLNAAPQSGNVVDIYINGIYQNKDTFSVAGAVITFSEAPPAGADNIEVQVTVTIALGETDASLVTYGVTTVEAQLDSVDAQLDAISAASGSSLVGFQQAGAGAVVRTAQDKMREWVSVKDFGAIGDGTADDTAAIQSAINDVAYTTSGFYGEVTGKILYFPAGVYKLSAPLTVPANAGIHFVGEGKTRTTLWQSINDVNIFNVTGNNFKGGFRSLRLTGNQGQVGGVAKAINIGPPGNQIYVEDCWINTVGYAIYGNPTSDSNVLNNVIEYVLTPIYLAGTGNGYFTINDNVFYNCGPVSQGGGEQRASFEFQSTTQCIMSNNRFVSDSAMSPQTGGYIVVNNVNDFLFTENVMSVSSLNAANVIITNSNKIKLTDNTFPEAWKQQLILNNCTDVVVANNKLAKMKDIGVYGVNLVDVIDVQKLRFIGNTVGEATAYVMHIRTTCEDIVIVNNTFDGGANLPAFHTILVEGTSQAVVTGNTFRNGNEGRDFACNTVTDLILHGNALDRGFEVDPSVSPTNIYGNVGGVTRTHLNAAPVFGTWKQGDIVWFQQPTAGGFVGAVCVADGTPGTWKTFGAITP